MYTKGEVVWAKIKGFPWWPGIVAKVIEDRDDPTGISEILVNFIGENSHAQLSLDKVAKFQQKYNEYAKMKKKKLLESIEAANRIVRGESTFKSESVRLENKDHIPQIPKRKKETKPNTKSSHNKDNESGSGSESGEPSDDGSNSPPALTKSKSTQKPAETKQLKRQNSTPKPSNGKGNGGSNKNSKGSVGNKRELEDTKNSGEPKVVKMLKGNDASEHVSSPDSRNLEELNGKFERHISCPPLIPAQNGKMNISDISLDNKDFDAIRDLLVEKIANHGKSLSVSGPILEKSIESVISKINPETVPISEIVDKELGKNIYTLIVLIEQLLNCGPKNGMNVETELGTLKNKLMNYNDIFKTRVVSQYIENKDACAPWLKKVEQKKQEKPTQKELHHKGQESLKNSKIDKLQQQLNELADNPSSRLEEEVSEAKAIAAPNPLQMNFEEFRYDDKKKVPADKNPKMVTTSTKVTKPIYNTNTDMKKAEARPKDNVMNPNLRKKICLKMSKILQEKYGLAKDAAQTMTLKVETRIRNSNPEMGSDYKDKILVVLKLLKYSMKDIEEYANDSTIDFFNLREKLEVLQQQNADVQLEAPFGDDSPSSTKEISREVSIINGKMC